MLMKLLLLFIIATLLSASSVEARTVTTRKALKLRKEVKESVQARLQDTIFSVTDSVVVAGYDKMLRSTNETFFVINNSCRHISSISLTFTYYDLQNRMLHSRTSTIECDIPASETRQLSITSWDSQQLFYYYNSPAPRRAATPYTITYRIEYITVDKQ